MYLTTKLTPVCAGDSHECMLPVKSGFDQDFDTSSLCGSRTKGNHASLVC